MINLIEYLILGEINFCNLKNATKVFKPIMKTRKVNDKR